MLKPLLVTFWGFRITKFFSHFSAPKKKTRSHFPLNHHCFWEERYIWACNSCSLVVPHNFASISLQKLEVHNFHHLCQGRSTPYMGSGDPTFFVNRKLPPKMGRSTTLQHWGFSNVPVPKELRYFSFDQDQRGRGLRGLCLVTIFIFDQPAARRRYVKPLVSPVLRHTASSSTVVWTAQLPEGHGVGWNTHEKNYQATHLMHMFQEIPSNPPYNKLHLGSPACVQHKMILMIPIKSRSKVKI